MSAVARAFVTWQGNTHFTFSQAQSVESADLKIGFGRDDHGDGANNAFDGPGKTIAHAFPPSDGRFHYDADETWVVGAVPGGFDLETVALHEIGHLLGLHHSDVPGAVMQSAIPPGYTQSLHADDTFTSSGKNALNKFKLQLSSASMVYQETLSTTKKNGAEKVPTKKETQKNDRSPANAVSGAYDLETVALHEIGHLLGLGHSSVQGAIMYPTITPGVTKGLHGDDIQGIKALYNA
ncbi:metalloendoproteinase 3-MMP-like [Prunus avium]|uniref:Metalloendoproteinase 3-MMP-like n=1 Tax=Prunus avium TaxID=42229 RepID=A0A6P5RJ84_PRUAV|nr:metalloendoproteinase 3-MMP-like [Prunus avium]